MLHWCANAVFLLALPQARSRKCPVNCDEVPHSHRASARNFIGESGLDLKFPDDFRVDQLPPAREYFGSGRRRQTRHETTLPQKLRAKESPNDCRKLTERSVRGRRDIDHKT
jgi:hypothetical protein